MLDCTLLVQTLTGQAMSVSYNYHSLTHEFQSNFMYNDCRQLTVLSTKFNSNHINIPMQYQILHEKRIHYWMEGTFMFGDCNTHTGHEVMRKDYIEQQQVTT